MRVKMAQDSSLFPIVFFSALASLSIVIKAGSSLDSLMRTDELFHSFPLSLSLPHPTPATWPLPSLTIRYDISTDTNRDKIVVATLSSSSRRGRFGRFTDMLMPTSCLCVRPSENIPAHITVTDLRRLHVGAYYAGITSNKHERAKYSK